MVRLFVKPDKEILNIVNKGIEKCNGNLLKFSREVNICRTTIYHWFENRIWIDIKKLKKICDYLDSDYLRLIEGKYVHSTRSNPEIFNKEWFKLNPNIAILLGWFCTDGYIPKNCCRIEIFQNDKATLERLKTIVKNEYQTNNKVIIRPGKNRDGYSLEINSPMLKYVLVNYFGIKEGKKNFIVSVPKQIFKSSKECKWAFLAASIEGDGSWPIKTLTIRMTSKNYIKGCKRLLRSLGYKSIASPMSQENVWIWQVAAKVDICKIIHNCLPYVINQEKFQHFIKQSYFQNRFFKNLFIEFDNEVILKAKNKLDCSFRDLTKQIKRTTGFNYSHDYMQSLLNNHYQNRKAKIRLPVLIAISEVLKDRSIIPKEFLWLIENIKYKDLMPFSNESIKRNYKNR